MSLPNIFRRRLLGVALAVASAAALLAQQSGTHALPSAPADPNAPSASAFSFRAPPSGGAAFSRYMSADALALDPQGNVFVTGFTGVPDLPGLGNAFQNALKGTGDAYVIKFDQSGRVLWSTYLGGNDRRSGPFIFRGDTPYAIAVDPQGQVTLVGDTGSTDFPTTSSAVLPLPLAVIGTDGFVAKFSADGSRLLYSTYLGAPDAPSTVRGVATGPSGDTWVAVNSRARIATRFDLSGGTGGIVIVKLNPSGTPVWSTRVPGRELHAFAVDASGDVYYATGCCASPADPQVSRLDAAGTHFVYRAALPLGISLFLVTDLAISPDGSALAVALSGETTIPTPRPLDAPPLPFPDPARSGAGDDALVGIFDAGGRFSTLGTLAGRSDEAMGRLAKVAVGPAGFAIGFDTLSGDLPGVRPWVADHVDGPLFISTDRGDTWSRAAEKTLSAPIEHLAVEGPSNMLHAATRSGLYLSIDHGATWTQERAGPHTIVAINPRDPRERYISDGLVVSRHDRGQAEGTLLLRAQFPGSIRVIAVNQLDNSIWVSGNFGVDVSYDGGRTWISRRSGLPDDRATGRVVSPDAIVFDPQRPERIYLGTAVGLYATDDGGRSWRNLTAGISQLIGGVVDVNAVAVEAADVRTLYVGTGRGLWVSRDEGVTWSDPVPAVSIRALATDPLNPGHLYASIEDADPETPPTQGWPRVWRSVDRGMTWPPSARNGRMRRSPRQLVVHASDSNRVFAVSGYYSYVPFLAQFAQAAALPTVARPIAAPSGNADAEYRRALATYLAAGSLRDIAISPTGEMVALVQIRTSSSLTQPAEFVVIRFGR